MSTPELLAFEAIPFDDDADEVQTWKGLAISAIMDSRRYAHDQDPERRMLSAEAYEADAVRIHGLAQCTLTSSEPVAHVPPVAEAYRRFPDITEPSGHPLGTIVQDRGSLRYAFIEGARFAAQCAPQPSEEERLRAEQLQAGAPHIGPLLDAWDGMMNDQRAGIKTDAPESVERFQALYGAWMESPALPAAGGEASKREAEIVERCIKICLEEAGEWDSDNVQTLKNYAGQCANRISEEALAVVPEERGAATGGGAS